jgi:hypothetical protein
MTQRAYKHPKWARARRRKSSRSNGGTSGQCVEVLYTEGEFGLADTKLGENSPIVELPTASFLALVNTLKSGEIQ